MGWWEGFPSMIRRVILFCCHNAHISLTWWTDDVPVLTPTSMTWTLVQEGAWEFYQGCFCQVSGRGMGWYGLNGHVSFPVYVPGEGEHDYKRRLLLDIPGFLLIMPLSSVWLMGARFPSFYPSFGVFWMWTAVGWYHIMSVCIVWLLPYLPVTGAWTVHRAFITGHW